MLQQQRVSTIVTREDNEPSIAQAGKIRTCAARQGCSEDPFRLFHVQVIALPAVGGFFGAPCLAATSV